MEPLWNEATMIASSRHVFGTASVERGNADRPQRMLRDARASSRAVYSVEKVFSESQTDVVFLLVACGGSPPCALEM